jgi:hypothetical protein
MSKLRPSFVLLALCLAAGLAARAQGPVTPLDRVLSRISLGVSAPVEYTRTTSGSYSPYTINSQQVSTASGYLINGRYIVRRYVGFEGNYKYSRTTQNFTYTEPAAPPQPLGTYQTNTLGVEANITEATFGYVAQLPKLPYARPYASVGAGSTRFKPTPVGGQGVHIQWRATYYWSLGADARIYHSPVDFRVQIRQLFYLAPDFGESYLTSHAHTSTFEPSVGFNFHF